MPKITDNMANIEKIVGSHCIDNLEKILHPVFYILMQKPAILGIDEISVKDVYDEP